MSNTEYLDQFKACVDVIEAYGGTPGSHPGIMKDVLDEITGVDMYTHSSGIKSDHPKAARKTSRERYLACIFISGEFIVRYSTMKRDSHN